MGEPRDHLEFLKSQSECCFSIYTKVNFTAKKGKETRNSHTMGRQGKLTIFIFIVYAFKSLLSRLVFPRSTCV